MKAPSPLFILIFSLALIYRGFVAFFPSLRGENKKKRKPIPRLQGIVYLFAGLLGSLYSVYVIYVFAGGSFRVLPIEDETLFRSTDMLLLAPIVLALVFAIIKRVFSGKRKGSEP